MTQFADKCNEWFMTDNSSLDYVLGYGSLIEQHSRTRTNPRAQVAAPVIVENVARGWWIHGNKIGYSPCFLGVQPQAGARCNGVVYPVTGPELEALDRREARYTRLQISARDVTLLDGGAGLPPDSRLWVYTVPDALRVVPTARFPIVQSYVDICLNGCLEIEATYPQAQAASFAKMFIEATQDWNRYWVNDRLYPRRPHVFVPRAHQIDTLLHTHLPDLFAQIPLEPTAWDE